MKRYLQTLSDSVQDIGDRWRLVEGPYPHSGAPWCLQFQYRAGTAWKTVRAFKPDGTDA